MEAEAAEGLGARPLDLELDAVALLRRLDLEAVDGFPGRAALLDVDGDVRLVRGLDLDRAVEGREVESGVPVDRLKRFSSRTIWPCESTLTTQAEPSAASGQERGRDDEEIDFIRGIDGYRWAARSRSADWCPRWVCRLV